MTKLSRTERNRLIEENLPLVGYLARDTHARATHVPKEDLISAGMEAVVKAADSFDPAHGVPFGAYARHRIIGAFADEMRSMDWASRGARKRIKEVTEQREKLSALLGRPATAEEIATAMGVPRASVSEALDDAGRTITTIDDEVLSAACTSVDLPEESALLSERRAHLAEAVAALPERMQFIIEAVYVKERQVVDVAEELGVSHSAISQQRAEAIRLLRDALNRFEHGKDAQTTSRVSEAAREAYFSRIDEAIQSR